MKCFNHNESDAIGECKHCCKGLCSECATDLDFGLACKDRHEKEVEYLHSLIENNKKAYINAPNTVMLSNIFMLFMGLLFIYFGYEKSKFLLIFGVLCLVYWVALTLYNSKYLKNMRTDYET